MPIAQRIAIITILTLAALAILPAGAHAATRKRPAAPKKSPLVLRVTKQAYLWPGQTGQVLEVVAERKIVFTAWASVGHPYAKESASLLPGRYPVTGVADHREGCAFLCQWVYFKHQGRSLSIHETYDAENLGAPSPSLTAVGLDRKDLESVAERVAEARKEGRKVVLDVIARGKPEFWPDGQAPFLDRIAREAPRLHAPARAVAAEKKSTSKPRP